MINPCKSARTLLAGLSLASALCGTSFALPEGGTVGNGQVNIGSPINGQMTIQQLSDRAIINWNGFSINSGELVRFVQPGQLSAILNRITGQDPSLILGSLQANGRVFLINPNGIVFGKDSQVNVGSLFASTLTLKDEDFLNDRFKLDLATGQTPAAIVNEGTLHMAPGGFLVLASPLISNQGVILANVGQVALAAGSHSEINFDGQGLINLMVDTPHGDPGTVAISHGMLDSMVGDLLNLGPANSMTSLDGGLQIAGAEGRLVNTGEVHADGAPGLAAGRVVVNSSQGTFLRPGSVLSANGQGENSNGGSVQAISEGLAVLDPGARLEARPGTTGEGGFVEFSGHTGVRFNGQVDAGSTGRFLLDPTNLRIVNPGPGSLDVNLPIITFADGGASETVSSLAINSSVAGIVNLEATNSITQDANAPINRTNPGEIIMQTQTGDIILPAGVRTNGGMITIIAGRHVSLGTQGGTTDNFSTGGSGAIQVTAGNNTLLGDITVAGNITAPAVNLQARHGGSITNPGQTALITTGNLDLSATTIGTSSERLGYTSPGPDFFLNLSGTSGNAFLAQKGSIPTHLVSAPGNLDILSDSEFQIAGQFMHSPTSALNITTTSGSIKYNPAVPPAFRPTLEGSTITLNGAGGIFGANLAVFPIIATGAPLQTATANLNLTSGGNIYVTNSQSATVNATGLGALVNVTGDVTVGDAGIAGTTGTGLIASGNILATGTSGTVGNSAASLTLLDATNIGAGGSPIKTAGQALDLTATGAAHVQQAGATTLFVNVPGGDVEVESNAGVSIANSTVANPVTGLNMSFNTSPNHALQITTSAGSIAYDAVALANPTLQGTSITLTAPSGIGSAAKPILTDSPILNLTSTSGDIRGLDAQSATVSAQAGGTADINVTGSATVGAAGIAGASTTRLVASGDILGSSGRVGVAGSFTHLNGANIGTVATPLKTAGQSLDISTTGQVHLDQAGPTTISVNPSNGDVSIASDSSVTLASSFDTSPSANLSILTTAGSIAYLAANPTNPTLQGNVISLEAPAGIGSSATPIKTNANSLHLTSSAGSVHVAETDAVTVSGQAGQDFALSSGPMTIGQIQATQAINLTADGNIQGGGVAPAITGGSANLTATGTVGAPGLGLTTQVATLNANGANGVFISQQGSVNVSAQSSAGPIDLDVDGDATLGLLDAATTIKVQTCPTGSILDGNGDALNIQSGQATTLVSPGVIGTRPDPLDVNVASGALNVASGGQLDGVSISIKGTAPNNALSVIAPPDPPVGTTCFVGLPPGLVLFNVAPEPPVPPPTPPAPPIVVTPERVVLGATETVQAVESVQLQTTLFNPALPLDIRGEVMGSAFTPFYTFSLAFLIDEEDWLAFLHETVVWEADEEESQELK